LLRVCASPAGANSDVQPVKQQQITPIYAAHSQAHQHLRARNGSTATDHGLQQASDDEHWQYIAHTDSPSPPPPLGGTASRSSSLASILSQQPNPAPGTLPSHQISRTGSPFAPSAPTQPAPTPTVVRAPNRDPVQAQAHPPEQREHKRSGGAAAVNIINSLSPAFDLPKSRDGHGPRDISITRDGHAVELIDDRSSVTNVFADQALVKDDKRDRKGLGFWDWAATREERKMLSHRPELGQPGPDEPLTRSIGLSRPILFDPRKLMLYQVSLPQLALKTSILPWMLARRRPQAKLTQRRPQRHSATNSSAYVLCHLCVDLRGVCLASSHSFLRLAGGHYSWPWT
jgi:hypothetical protein